MVRNASKEATAKSLTAPDARIKRYCTTVLDSTKVFRTFTRLYLLCDPEP